jgi:hypothetical protein
MGLVGVDNTILVMEERLCLAVFKSLKIDVERLLIDKKRKSNRIFFKNCKGN